jgi:mRNA-degrading endonuclease RelE of RelBE toxin-antitoxin system
MRRRPKYTIMYAPEVSRHVDAIERKYHRVIERAITKQLSHMPDTLTRNRKPLEDLPGPCGSTWELRCGPNNRFRVFYEVSQGENAVWVLAIGLKERSRLFIEGEEFEP